MNRRSDIGWFELIVGIILIIFGVVIMRQPVGVLTWIVILCGVLAILSGIGDMSKWNTLPGLDRSFHLSQES